VVVVVGPTMGVVEPTMVVMAGSTMMVVVVGPTTSKYSS